MKGDYHTCQAEFATGNDRKEAAENSLVAYEATGDIAMTELPPKHPICLGLALKFSVFYYDILNSPDCACRLAKAAFDDVIAELDMLSEESYKDNFDTPFQYDGNKHLKVLITYDRGDANTLNEDKRGE